MTRLLIILMIFANFISCKGKTTQIDKTEIVSYQTQFESMKPDSTLFNIQDAIHNAFMKDIMSPKNEELAKLGKQLENLYNANNQNLILYWRSYLQFYSSIYYIEKGDKINSEKEIDKGISWLDDMKKKNSEDYALLSMLQGFCLQFKGMKVMFVSQDVKKNANNAIALDSTNLRAYYVYASNDFYTPENYGGGKDAEKYLLKAISLPAQKIKNDYLPSWGKEESYEMLIKLYISKEKWELAKKYFQEGIAAFPNSYELNQLASKLVGK